MLTNNLKILHLALGIIFITGCSSSEDKTNVKKVKNTQKAILIECKSNQEKALKTFNAKIEIFSMTDDVLTKLNKKRIERKATKIAFPIYAIIKNIEGLEEKSCQNAFFYGNRPLEKVSSSYEIKLSPISKDCNKMIFLAFKEVTLLQPFSNPPKKIEDAPFISNCHIVK